jgi:hypothetical protein
MQNEIEEFTLETAEKAPPPEERNWRIIIEWAILAGGILAIFLFFYSIAQAPKVPNTAIAEAYKSLADANITIKPAK